MTEQLSAALRKAISQHEFAPGVVVNIPGAGFESMTGRVIKSQGRYTIVEVNGFTDGLRIDSVALANKNQGD